MKLLKLDSDKKKPEFEEMLEKTPKVDLTMLSRVLNAPEDVLKNIYSF